jgi:hypothetical protein
MLNLLGTKSKLFTVAWKAQWEWHLPASLTLQTNLWRIKPQQSWHSKGLSLLGNISEGSRAIPSSPDLSVAPEDVNANSMHLVTGYLKYQLLRKCRGTKSIRAIQVVIRQQWYSGSGKAALLSGGKHLNSGQMGLGSNPVVPCLKEAWGMLASEVLWAPSGTWDNTALRSLPKDSLIEYPFQQGTKTQQVLSFSCPRGTKFRGP